MKTTLLRFAAAFAFAATTFVSPAFSQDIAKTNAYNTTAVATDPGTGTGDAEAKDNLRVIFLPSSTYSDFKVAMENRVKSDVYIEILDEQGAIVHTQHLKKVSKRIKEMDLSYLKRGEYTVKVSNAKSEFTKKVIIP